ncbi:MULTISPECIES: DUF1992 domain-containing protein [unclassified Diaminobutyricimonas]|uniref:DnaJ family domain-containing protein n=1 Tax=unclassified Diaminobutyricimonas TaxID=2643261 RepID=UPI0012F4DB46|nr:MULTISPECIES: DUF1992 domain-containing protein [unclassified Diaminobutyricimonas]
MTGKRPPEDARLKAARYRLDPALAEEQEQEPAAAPTADQRAQISEMAIQQAIRRGEFDNLPGTGKPLTNLNRVYDPDWWLRQKIESERITGLGPPALTLRTEDAALNERLDGVSTEAEVRSILEDFNRRVIEARRQLLGGPPVITPTRDIDSELERWRARRAALREQAQAVQQVEAPPPARSWRERRRAKKAR